jgi:hypothetical protein
VGSGEDGHPRRTGCAGVCACVRGAIADVANAGLFAAEGKYDMTAMSMLSAIPESCQIVQKIYRTVYKQIFANIMKTAKSLEPLAQMSIV